MAIPPGDYPLGPDNGALLLHTGTDGVAAAMGHNLTLEATTWSADLTIADRFADSTLVVTADLTSLVVIDGHGGAKPLTDRDRAKIQENAAKILQTDRHPRVDFVATGIVGDGDGAIVRGRLSLHGHTEPIELTLDAPDPGNYRLTGTIVQHLFGIAPYSALGGALRLADAIDLEVSIPFE